MKPRHYVLAGSILIFIILQIFNIVNGSVLWWDEAVYLTMGKFLLSGGSLGFWEILRPPVWPLLLGLASIFSSPENVGRLFMVAVAIIGSLIVYRLLDEEVDKRIALLIAILLLVTDPWYAYSSRLLTGLLSGVIALAALLCYKKKMHAWAGVLGALAFLTRFATGLVLAAIGIGYLVEFFRGKKKRILPALTFGAAAGAVILAWLLGNWLSWSSQTSMWWHAAFRPLIMGGNNVFFDNLWLYDSTYGFYFKHLLLTLPLSALALAGLWRARKRSGLLPTGIFAVLMLIFLTVLPHNEWRFILSALPAIFVLIALGIDPIARLAHKRGTRIVQTVLIMFIIIGLAGALQQTSFTTPPENPLDDTYNYLAAHPVEGTVIITDPVFAAYIDNKITPIYYERLPQFSLALEQPHDAVVFVPQNFPCPPEEQSRCREQVRRVVDSLTRNERLIHRASAAGRDYYIFSTKDWYTALPVSELRAEYDLAPDVALSPFPGDRMPVVFILEDFPSVTEDGESIWYPERFERVLDSFSGMPATAAYIPTHLRRAEQLRAGLREDLQGFEIGQNGYDHTSLLQADQSRHINDGRRLLESFFGQAPSAFVPPYYEADEDSAMLLADAGYSVYVTSAADTSESIIPRLDQTTSTILNWERQYVRTADEILDDLSRTRLYGEYGLLSFYYFMYNESDMVLLNETLERISQEYSVMTASQLASWRRLSQDITLDVNGSLVEVQAPTGIDNVTLLAYASGEYEITSNVPVLIKNDADENLRICVGQCEEVEPQSFFLSRSPIVSPAESEATS